MMDNPDYRVLSDNELIAVSGGTTNFQTAAGAAFLTGFLAGGGTLGDVPAPIKMQPGPNCYPAPGSTGHQA